MARLAVDAHVLDAFDSTRLLDALDLLEHAFRRDEEADDRAAHLRHRMERGRPDRLAERRLEREAVQVDAERGVDELRVVPAADPGRDLDHLRPVGPDPKLRVGRPVLDAERLDGGARDLGRLATGLARPDVGERDPERRRLRGQPVGDGQRMELAAHRERVDGHLRPVHELLDDRSPTPGLFDRPRDRRRQLVLGAHERQPLLPLAIGCLDHPGLSNSLLQSLFGALDDLPVRLRDARFGETLALLLLGDGEARGRVRRSGAAVPCARRRALRSRPASRSRAR